MNEKQSIIQKIINNFKDINKTTYGNELSTIQDKINNLSIKVSKFSNISTRNIFNDLLKYLYNKPKEKIDNNDIDKLLQDFDINTISESDRFLRYENYKEIVLKISYAKRALQVIKDSIISSDDYTVNSIKYFRKNLANNELDTIEKIFKEIVHKTGIYDNIDEIIESSLCYGDFFVEIININEVLKSKKLINDNKIIRKITENVDFYKDLSNDESIEDKLETNNISFNLEINDSLKFENILNEKSNLTFDDIFLEFHNPFNVVILGNKIPLGFLVFPETLQNIQLSNISNLGISNKSLNNVLDKIIRNLKLEDNKEELKENPELRKMVAKLILYTNDNDNTLNNRIRFVSVDNMEHFKINCINNKPYGKSIFYGQEFLAKILILIQTTIGIQRISNSGDRRIVNVEIGLPRDAKNIVEQMKKKFKRKRYSIDDIGTIKEIPSQLSSFETLYLPMKDGKRFIEFDTLNDNKNINERVEDFNAIRDSFVAGLLVPPAYLGLEENVESKSMLTHENIIFSRLIVNLQKIFSEQLTHLVRKIYNIIYGKNYLTDEIDIIFSKPKALKLEMDNEYYSNLVTLVNTFKELGYTDEYIKNKYLLDDIDKTEIENIEIKNKISKIMEKPKEDENVF